MSRWGMVGAAIAPGGLSARGGGGGSTKKAAASDGGPLRATGVHAVNSGCGADPPVEVTPIPNGESEPWRWDTTSTDGSTTGHGAPHHNGTEVGTTPTHQRRTGEWLNSTLTYH